MLGSSAGGRSSQESRLCTHSGLRVSPAGLGRDQQRESPVSDLSLLRPYRVHSGFNSTKSQSRHQVTDTEWFPSSESRRLIKNVFTATSWNAGDINIKLKKRFSASIQVAALGRSLYLRPSLLTASSHTWQRENFVCFMNCHCLSKRSCQTQAADCQSREHSQTSLMVPETEPQSQIIIFTRTGLPILSLKNNVITSVFYRNPYISIQLCLNFKLNLEN